MSSRTIHLMGYGPTIRNKRAVYTAMSLLEAYQETVKARKQGRPPPVEWTYQTETGRKMLGLEVGFFYRAADQMRPPPGLTKCPKCLGEGCQICNWAGETTRRALNRYAPWQLENKPKAKE